MRFHRNIGPFFVNECCEAKDLIEEIIKSSDEVMEPTEVIEVVDTKVQEVKVEIEAPIAPQKKSRRKKKQ
jgi:urease gamma subunit